MSPQRRNKYFEKWTAKAFIALSKKWKRLKANMIMSRVASRWNSFNTRFTLSFYKGATEAPAHVGEQFSIVFWFGGEYGYNMPTLEYWCMCLSEIALPAMDGIKTLLAMPQAQFSMWISVFLHIRPSGGSVGIGLVLWHSTHCYLLLG